MRRSLARNCDARRRLLASVGHLNHRDSGEHERCGVDRAHANRFADERPSQHKRNERIHIGIGRHARGVEDTNIWQAQDFFATEIGDAASLVPYFILCVGDVLLLTL